jgi:hypothetical protein
VLFHSLQPRNERRPDKPELPLARYWRQRAEQNAVLLRWAGEIVDLDDALTIPPAPRVMFIPARMSRGLSAPGNFSELVRMDAATGSVWCSRHGPAGWLMA